MSKLLTILAAVTISFPVFADNHKKDDKTVGEKIESGYEKTKDATKEAYDDTKKASKKAYRAAKDKTCEMVNGKMECAAQKAGHKIQNAADEVKDKANDVTRDQDLI